MAELSIIQGGWGWDQFCLFSVKRGSPSTTKPRRPSVRHLTPLAQRSDNSGQPQIVYEVIAKRIIDAAKSGERDVARLRDAGLAALGPPQ